MGSPKVKRPTKSETVEDVDNRFDGGEDVFTDGEAIAATWKVNLEFPRWMVDELDKMASRLAEPRQAMIKMLVDEGDSQSKKGSTRISGPSIPMVGGEPAQR